MLNTIRKKMPDIHKKIMTRICLKVVARSQSVYLTGGNPLHTRTSRLKKGMFYRLIGNFKGVVGNNVKYAKVHDSPNVADRTIVPKTANRLFIPLHSGAKGGYKQGMKFGVDFALAKKVVMPHRPFIRPAIKDVVETSMIDKIIQAGLQYEFDQIEKAVRE